MTLDDLIKQNKIHIREYKIYVLFASSQLGSEWLKENIIETFMEDATIAGIFAGEAFAYLEGKRSLLRGIQSVIEKVNNLLKEEIANDNGTGK